MITLALVANAAFLVALVFQDRTIRRLRRRRPLTVNVQMVGAAVSAEEANAAIREALAAASANQPNRSKPLRPCGVHLDVAAGFGCPCVLPSGHRVPHSCEHDDQTSPPSPHGTATISPGPDGSK